MYPAQIHVDLSSRFFLSFRRLSYLGPDHACGSWLAREYMPAHQQCGRFKPLDCGEVQGLF